MALVNVTNIKLLNNPCPIRSPFVFEISFEALATLQEDIEWRVLYVGSSQCCSSRNRRSTTSSSSGGGNSSHTSNTSNNNSSHNRNSSGSSSTSHRHPSETSSSSSTSSTATDTLQGTQQPHDADCKKNVTVNGGTIMKYNNEHTEEDKNASQKGSSSSTPAGSSTCTTTDTASVDSSSSLACDNSDSVTPLSNRDGHTVSMNKRGAEDTQGEGEGGGGKAERGERNNSNPAANNKTSTAAQRETDTGEHILDAVLLGPIEEGVLAFEFAVHAPPYETMDAESVVGMQAVLVCALYRQQEFIRIGYYLNNAYSDAVLRENPPDVPLYDKLVRCIVEEPRVTRFPIRWDEALPVRQQPRLLESVPNRLENDVKDKEVFEHPQQEREEGKMQKKQQQQEKHQPGKGALQAGEQKQPQQQTEQKEQGVKKQREEEQCQEPQQHTKSLRGESHSKQGGGGGEKQKVSRKRGRENDTDQEHRHKEERADTETTGAADSSSVVGSSVVAPQQQQQYQKHTQEQSNDCSNNIVPQALVVAQPTH